MAALPPRFFARESTRSLVVALEDGTGQVGEGAAAEEELVGVPAAVGVDVHVAAGDARGGAGGRVDRLEAAGGGLAGVRGGAVLGNCELVSLFVCMGAAYLLDGDGSGGRVAVAHGGG